MAQNILLVVFAYLLGAVPFGYLIGRYYGKDIRQEGSGNIGSTNVTRVIGKWPGRFCFLCDCAKGMLPVLLAREVAPGTDLPLLAGAAAIVGHMFPVYLRFKGGKGIATAAGVAAALSPLSLLAALLGWGMCFALTRYVSLASIVAAIMLPVAATVLYVVRGTPTILTMGFFYAVGAVAILKHRSNLQRLCNGTEKKF